MSAPAGPAIKTHASSRAGAALLQSFFGIALLIGVLYVVRSSRDYGFALVLALLGLGGVFVVRWLSAHQPRLLRVHENGLALEWEPIVPFTRARSALFGFDQLNSVTRDADLDGQRAYVVRVAGLPPIRLSPLKENVAPLDAFATELVTRAGLTWAGATARRADAPR